MRRPSGGGGVVDVQKAHYYIRVVLYIIYVNVSTITHPYPSYNNKNNYYSHCSGHVRACVCETARVGTRMYDL